MTAKTAINRQDLAAACKFTDKKRPMLAVVRVRLDADGLRCQSTDSFRAFGYVRADAAPADESAFFDVSVKGLGPRGLVARAALRGDRDRRQRRRPRVRGSNARQRARDARRVRRVHRGPLACRGFWAGPTLSCLEGVR